MEQAQRGLLCKSSQALKMESSFDANSERECSVCLFDLHLSAAGCHHCSPDKYACLNHARQLCSCSWGSKFFLFRYDINELKVLVEALEGKLSAVYRWARLDLGLALSSYVSKDNKQVSGVIGKVSCMPQGLASKDTNALSSAISSKEQIGTVDGDIFDSTKYIGSPNSSQKLKPPVVVLALENMKGSSNLSSQKTEAAKHCSPYKKENSPKPAPSYKASSCKLSQVSSLKPPSTEEKPEGSQSLFPGNNDVILLSDDEGDVPNTELVKDIHNGSVQKPVCPDNMVSVASCVQSSDSGTTITGPSVMLERVKHVSDPECIKAEEGYSGPNPISSSCSKSGLEIPVKKETPSCDEANADGDHKPKPINDEKSHIGDCRKNMELDVDTRPVDSVQTVSCNPSVSQNVLDRYYRQKGPRMAKVVRRINCNVEPLDFGAVRAGKLWCDSRAIYPKGTENIDH